MQAPGTEQGFTSVIAEGAEDVGGCVTHIALPKGRHKILADSGIAVPAALCGPLLHELCCHPLVVAADEAVGVVDGGTVHWVPRHSPSAPGNANHNLED